MTKENTITTTPASKATGKAQSCLFENFCELMTRLFLALEEDEWADDAGRDIAFEQSMSDADIAWKLVAVQAEAVDAVYPFSRNDLLLHRMAGVVLRAVSAPSIFALEGVQARAIRCIAQAPDDIAAAVYDLADEARISIDQLVENAYANDVRKGPCTGLPLAA